jgi:hypothetical protein
MSHELCEQRLLGLGYYQNWRQKRRSEGGGEVGKSM